MSDVAADSLTIAGREFASRLILGTGGFTNHDLLGRALEAAGAQMCTVALRRVDPAARGSILDVLEAAAVPGWFCARIHFTISLRCASPKSG